MPEQFQESPEDIAAVSPKPSLVNTTFSSSSIENRTNDSIILFGLWLLLFSSSSQIMIISPILPEIGRALDIAESIQGTLVTAYAVAVGLFALLIGPVSDRIGRRKVLLMGTGFMAVSLALHAFATNYISLLAFRCLAGIGGGILSGSTVAFVGDYFSYNKRGWANGWIMSGLAFGQIIGIPAGIFFAGLYGFRAPFLIFSVVCALSFILLLFYLPQPKVRLSKKRITLLTALRKYQIMLMKKEIAISASVYFLMFFSLSVFFVYLPTWLKTNLDATDNQISLMFMFGGVANVIAGPNAGKLSDRIGRRNIIVLANSGLALLILSTTFLINEVWIAYPYFLFLMACIATRISPFQALITTYVSAKRRGSFLSLLVAIGQVGYGLGGTISGPAYVVGGFLSNTLLAAAFVGLTAILVKYFLTEPKRS